MALTESTMTRLGSEASAFSLPNTHPEAGGETVSLDDFDDAEALVVVFTCNHCPYAQHVEESLIQAAKDYAERGVAFVLISSNNTETHPQDGPEPMAERARAKDYPFPYLYDETQEVAQAYGAVCTPDPFIFDREHRLAYRGRVDATRPGGGASTADELRRALDELLETGEVEAPQHPSIGCNIKWKEGNAPT